MSDLDGAAGRLAAEQHGLITRVQALDLGLSRSAIDTRTRTGRWVSAERGVYRINGAPTTVESKILTECFARRGFASHRSAAALIGVDDFQLDLAEISVPRGCRVARPGLVMHEMTDLHLFTPISIRAVPTTPVERLIVDLGAVVSRDRYFRAFECLIRRGLVTYERALHELLRHSRRGRNGVGALRAVLEETMGDDVGDSVLESVFIRELRRRGLLLPVSQFVVRDRGWFIARVDFAYPDLRIAIELDGFRYHGQSRFERDRDKRLALVTAGWQVIEITWKMLASDAAGVFRRLDRILRDAQAARV